MSQTLLSRGGEKERQQARLTAATLNALHELAIASGTRGVRAVARLAVDNARSLLDVEAAVVFTYDAERRLLLPVCETESAVPEAPAIPGEGAIGIAFETGLPVVVDDYQAWANAIPGSASRGMVSAIAVPLIAGDRPVGALGMWTYQRRIFTAEEEQLLTLFAAQVAPALEAARLNQQRDASARIFQALHEIAVAVGGMHEASEVAGVCVERARRLLNSDMAALTWWDEEHAVLRPLAHVGTERSSATVARIRPGEGAQGLAFKWKEPVVVADYHAWAHGTAAGRERDVRSVLAVPLIVGDRALGALAVACRQAREFPRADIELLRLLAAQIAPALEAARLLEASAGQVHELRSLHDIAVAAGGVLEPRKLAGLVVREACALLGTDRAVLRRWDPADELLEALADTGDGDPPPLKIGQGLAGSVFEAGRAMTVDDLQRWSAASEWTHRQGFASALVVPLVSHQRPIGTLAALTAEQHRFSDRDVQLLSLLAAQVAPALEAAQLADSLQQRARMFAALHELAVAASGLLDPQSLAQLMSQRARDLLAVDRVIVSIYDDEAGTIATLADSDGPEAERPPALSPGHGLSGLAYQRRQTLRVDDYRSWPGGVEWGRKRGIRSAIGMPLISQERVLGTIVAVSTRQRRFTDEDERVLSLLVSQLTPALVGARLHADLAASERALRAIYDTASVAIARTDLEGRLVWMNAAGRELFGYTDEELPRLTREDLLAPEAAGPDVEQLRDLVEGRSDRFRQERLHVKKDGTRFWGDVTIALVRGEDGQPDFYFAMVDDITERKVAEEGLRASEARKSAILEAALDSVIAIDAAGHVVELNPAAENAFGRDREAAVGRPVADLVVLPAEPADLAGTRVETTGRRSDGSTFPVEVSVGTLVEGEPPVRSLAVRDLSERKAAEAARRESEDRFRAVFDRAAIAIARVDLEGRVMEANPALYRMFGRAEGSLAGTSFEELVHPDDRDALHLGRLAAGEATEQQIEMRYPTGGPAHMWGNTIASAVRGPDGQPRFLIVMVEDTTLRKAHEAALEHRALHDPLTDLPNRSLFQDRLQQAILQARRGNEVGAVLVIDLDGFKAVNDHHGHHCGDQLLKQISSRLRAGLRGSDTVARLGGDEFGVVLPNIGGDSGAAFATAKLRAALEQPFDCDGHEVHVSASIGVALFPSHGIDPDQLVRRADAAMYECKRARP